jgi:hypothetical protein
MTHITTAAVDGPKAGMRQYLGKLATYRAGTKQRALLAEYLALGKGLSKSDAEKAIFAAYCANFTEEISAAQAELNADVDEGDLLSFLTGADSPEDDDTEDNVGVVIEQQGGRESVIDKVAKAVNGRRRNTRSGVPTVGDTFVYHGKNGDSTHTVVGEGLTKRHQKPGLTCRNENGKDRVWNLNTLAIYAEQGKLTIA